MRAVALEIPVQRAFAQRHGELVVGLGEMVESDVDVAGGGEQPVGHGEHRELLLGPDQLGAVDKDLLRRFDPGHMRVAENRKPVRAERQHIGDGAGEGIRGLQGQAVDQVHVDRLETGGAKPGEGGFVLPLGLDAVDRQLHLRVGVLHAERGAIGPDLLQGEHMLLGQAAGIDLDAELAAGGEGEKLADQCAQPAQFGGREKGRGAAAEVDLRDRPREVEPGSGQAHLP